MAAKAANALNIVGAGFPSFDGAATFTAQPTTTWSTLVTSGTANSLVSVANGASGTVLTGQGTAAAPVYAVPTFTQTWTDKGTSFNAVANNGYFSTAAVTATLPTGTANGQVCAFAVDVAPAAALTITAAASQFIRVGNAISGAAGTCVSALQGDSVTLVFRLSDLTWIATSVIGTWIVT